MENRRNVRRRLSYRESGRSAMEDTLGAYLDENAYNERRILDEANRTLTQRLDVANELNDHLMERLIDLTRRLTETEDERDRLIERLFERRRVRL